MKYLQIGREISLVAERFRRLRLHQALSGTWIAAALAGAVLFTGRSIWGWHVPWAGPALIAAVLLGALVAFVLARRVAHDTHWVARRIESTHPELDARLLAAIEQEPDLSDGKFGFLQRTLLTDVSACARRGGWRQTVPDRQLNLAGMTNAASFVGFALILTCLMTTQDSSQDRPGHGEIVDFSPRLPYRIEVDPGDTEIERGSSLLVLARFGEAIPPEVTLVLESDSTGERRLSMSKSLDDPLFGVRIPAVLEDLSYCVDFAGETSRDYRIMVFDYPELSRADAELVFPAYTELEPRYVQDTRHVSAVEGSELTWIFHLNKRVALALLLEENGEPFVLEAGNEENVYTTRIRLARSTQYQVYLVDDQGRENQEPQELAVRVQPNRLPELKLVFPRRDVSVSPLEELTLQAKAWDDFGMLRYGLGYTLAGRLPSELVLGEDTGGKESQEIRHLLDFEAFSAEPDQLLSYHFWAEDVGPDGEARRTSSDMYFAEVRPFEEIFREGEQAPGGDSEQRERQQQQGGQNAEDAGQLAELQKQIITGTWNLIRRDGIGQSAARGSEEGEPRLVEDTILLRDSQESALDQVDELAERLQDPESKIKAESVKGHMKDAVEMLTEAVEAPSPKSLRPPLAAEQSAYQALLKLRAREHRVALANNRQQSASGAQTGRSSSPSERRLQQLQLTSNLNRYETQRTASPEGQESQAQREDRQVLNRLRDLARRQSDLNERLKELNSALVEAENREEHEEIQRQLKRLRDEEQEILREVDELAQRMGEPENQERMADARDQLQDTRDNVRRASEALEEGRVSRATAEGTRAEREFRELGDDFRKRTARRFTEEMKEMRDDAERLDLNEQALSRELSRLTEDKGKSLRGTSERQKIEENLERQGQELEDLLERMQGTVEEAEEPEPLLAEKLYDTIRETRHTRTDEALDTARELLERGFPDEAAQAEEQASEGIRSLREGIDEAAESVLGDETEALRRARSELDRLSDEVEGEIARADGREPGEGDTASPEERNEDAASEVQGGSNASEDPAGDPNRSGSQRAERTDPQGENARDRSGSPERLRGGGNPNSSRGGRWPFLDENRDPVREAAPIAGEDFRDWSDRLRDVEEMIDDPDLRAEAARIRDRARALRGEIKRDSKKPNWDLVRVSVVGPLKALGERVGEELLRRVSKDALVPIDGDPVPPEYAERVRKYYERIGSGK